MKSAMLRLTKLLITHHRKQKGLNRYYVLWLDTDRIISASLNIKEHASIGSPGRLPCLKIRSSQFVMVVQDSTDDMLASPSGLLTELRCSISVAHVCEYSNEAKPGIV